MNEPQIKLENFKSIDDYLDIVIYEAEKREKEKVSKENKEL